MKLSLAFVAVLGGIVVGVSGASRRCGDCFKACDAIFKTCVGKAETLAVVKACWNKSCPDVSGVMELPGAVCEYADRAGCDRIATKSRASAFEKTANLILGELDEAPTQQQML